MHLRRLLCGGLRVKIIKILNYIFPLVIGAICSSLGTWLNIGMSNILQISLIFLLSIIFSILLYYDGKEQIESNQLIECNPYEIKFLMLKNIIIQLFALIIGALCSSLGDWNNIQPGFEVKFPAIIVVAIVYIIFVIISVIKDEELNKHSKIVLKKAQELNVIYEKVIQSIAEVNLYVTRDLRKTKKDIENGYMTIEAVERVAFLLCHELQEILAQYDTSDFFVSYSKKIDKKYIQTIAYADGNKHAIPYAFCKKRNISEDGHMDSIIMKTKPNSAMLVYTQKEIFDRRDRNFQRYLAIPVWNENEIQGIFQIIYYTESSLLIDEDIIGIFVKKILPQYASISIVINTLYELVLDMQKIENHK